MPPRWLLWRLSEILFSTHLWGFILVEKKKPFHKTLIVFLILYPRNLSFVFSLSGELIFECFYKHLNFRTLYVMTWSLIHCMHHSVVFDWPQLKIKIMIQVMWAATCIKYFKPKAGLIHTLCWLSLTTDSVNIRWVTLILNGWPYFMDTSL